ncbi:hypothetical protein NUU61_008656 [Penicillium alfredii]|uniref:EthD domain-containing protein n=1 Tax=Penicillium alfredii TaxID=1506179 RepID=A0A9W9JWX6_9EURO|nr:uncharacterized protein NUU61_008656 [Penicillium alfredii]KAJ5084077.1 hypothetical protein NUU61_008656 [Penicillium alfredii]
MAEKQQLVRLTMAVYRNPALSEEEFHRHWSQVHGPLVREWLAKNGIIRYTQNHTPTKMRELSKQLNWQVTDEAFESHDGSAEILMNDVGDLAAAFKDPYYTGVVSPDEQKLLDVGRTKMTFGWEESHVEGGAPVEL